MALAAWVIAQGNKITRVHTNDAVLERQIENWVQDRAEPALDGVTWVARQLVLPDHTRLDLLGITQDDQWVVAELKAAAVSRATLLQALHYAVYIGAMTSPELKSQLRNNPTFRSLDAGAAAQVEDLLDAESEREEARNISIMLIGTSRIDTLELAVNFLEQRGFNVPVKVVTFDLFAPPLLVRPCWFGRSRKRAPPNRRRSVGPLRRY